MHRVDAPGHVSNTFSDTAPTTLGAKWHNAVQEELAGLVVGSGRTLDASNNGQLGVVLATHVDTVAALLALASAPALNNQVFNTLGYWSAGDGGHAEYRWDAASTATHNGCSVLKVTSVTVGRFLLQVVGGFISSRQAGAKIDGTNDTAAVAALAVACGTLSVGMYLPRGSSGNSLHLITTQITVPTTVTGIKGDGKKYSGIFCDACGGFIFDAGYALGNIRDLAIVQGTRHTTTPNSFIGLRLQGSTGSRPFWITVEDIFIDGFGIPIQTEWVWSTTFCRITSVYGGKFLVANGTGVNNFIINCSVSGNGIGVTLGDGTNPIEGWVIHDNVIADFTTGVWGNYANNCQFTENILDLIVTGGILLESTANGPATNWIITDNYIGINNGGSYGIRCLNSHAASVAQHRGNSIADNQILGYSTLTYGILVDGTEEKNNAITNNKVKATSYDCLVSYGAGHSFGGNKWLGTGFSSAVIVDYSQNYGTVLSSQAILSHSVGKITTYFDSAAPTSGTYKYGDFVKNIAPLKGGHIGWICRIPGTPGTWERVGSIFMDGSATVDPISLVDGAQTAPATLACNDAVVGDFCKVSFSNDLQGVNLYAWISAADTASYVFQNETGGTVDLASGTLRVRAEKF